MCIYYRPLKNGNIQEFVFEHNRNTYELVNILGIIFSFTIEDRFVHFTINCNNFSNQGYGTALMSIMFDIGICNDIHISINVSAVGIQFPISIS